MAEREKWKAILEKSREVKDTFFCSNHPHSPIPLEERTKFNGLDYYPPNPVYRFELKLQEHKDKELIKIEATQGELREFIRWGEFRFKINNEEYTLQAYKSTPEESRLFIPFRDATSGSETYGAGRYIDLEPDEDRTTDGKWIFDFNEAYNPWCAYSDAYTCPLVPPENWLKIAILAGEKNYEH